MTLTLAPDGAAACSPRRQPWVQRNVKPRAPLGAAEFLELFPVPNGAAPNRARVNVLALPTAYTVGYLLSPLSWLKKINRLGSLKSDSLNQIRSIRFA